jgi:hypothetical protein
MRRLASGTIRKNLRSVTSIGLHLLGAQPMNHLDELKV